MDLPGPGNMRGKDKEVNGKLYLKQNIYKNDGDSSEKFLENS